jgi:hypothetical protein
LDRTVPTGSKINSSLFNKINGSFQVNSGKSLNTGNNGSASPATINDYVIDSNSDRILIVAITSEIVNNSTPRVSSVKFGTQEFKIIDSLLNGSTKLEMWYLLSPNVGTTDDISVNWQGTLECSISAGCFFNIDQENPILKISKNY